MEIRGNILDYIHENFSYMKPPIVVTDKKSFLDTSLNNHMYIKITTTDPELLQLGNIDMDPVTGKIFQYNGTDIIYKLYGVEKVFWSGRLRLVDYNKYPLVRCMAPYSEFFVTGLQDNFQFVAIRLHYRIKEQIMPMRLITGVINYINGEAFNDAKECPESYDEEKDGKNRYPQCLCNKV